MKKESEPKVALKTITIGRFWEQYPRIYILKTTIQIFLELTFLGFATYIIVKEFDKLEKSCE